MCRKTPCFSPPACSFAIGMITTAAIVSSLSCWPSLSPPPLCQQLYTDDIDQTAALDADMTAPEKSAKPGGRPLLHSQVLVSYAHWDHELDPA